MPPVKAYLKQLACLLAVTIACVFYYAEPGSLERIRSFRLNDLDPQNFRYQFDYLKLNLFWSPGFCLNSRNVCTRGSLAHHSIHGLWPNKLRGGHPANCKDQGNVGGDLDELEQDLNRHWFSHWGSSERFRLTEWKKHGTCAQSIPRLASKYDYFKTSLDLTKELLIIEHLEQRNIRPSHNQSYEYAEVHEALQSASGGKKAYANCFQYNGEAVITGFNFCYNHNLEAIDCLGQDQRCLHNRLKLLPDFMLSPTVTELIP